MFPSGSAFLSLADVENTMASMRLETPPMTPPLALAHNNEELFVENPFDNCDPETDRYISNVLSDLTVRHDADCYCVECWRARGYDTHPNSNNVVVQDCMWSGTGVLHNALESFRNTRNKSPGKSESESQLSSSYLSTTDCYMEFINPRSIDPTVPLHQYEPESPAESGEEDDVDIETIDSDGQKSSLNASFQSYSSDKENMVDDYLSSPTKSYTNSLSHVASMHNYSSTQPNPMNSLSPVINSSNSVGECSYSKRSRTYEYKNGEKKGRYSRVGLSGAGRHPYSRKSSYGNRNNSDSSDDCLTEGSKRAQHNVLERKRRNDLKSSFMTLRDHVPEIKTQERAAKVVILKKAAEYIYRLQRADKQFHAEKVELLKKQERLKRKISSLKNEQYSLY